MTLQLGIIRIISALFSYALTEQFKGGIYLHHLFRKSAGKKKTDWLK